MAETSTVKAPAKRRRILDPSAIIPVPIYSNQVNRSLQLKAPTFNVEQRKEAAEDDDFWSIVSCDVKKSPTMTVSDSDEETEPRKEEKHNDSDSELLRSPSPPPPESPVHKPSRKAKLKLNEIERRLKAVNSSLSPVDEPQRRGRPSPRIRNNADVIVLSTEDDDDVIIMTPDPSPVSTERQIPLKVRCRTDIHKIQVLPSTPLSAVVEQLSVTLGVPSRRLLLLQEEAELSPNATVRALGLGIADIIECAVMADDTVQTDTEKTDASAGDGDDLIKVRLQGKDRASAQEFSLHRDAPLGLVFSQYLSSLTEGAKKKVRFHFDGSKVSPQQTPAQLDMEDDDIIEVWT